MVRIIPYERSTLVYDEKYIGLDVHQSTIVVAVMDSTGKLVMESILETKAATILQFLAGNGRTAVCEIPGRCMACVARYNATFPECYLDAEAVCRIRIAS